jgi:6-phosphogluconolactonase/glucosamine-6-phosphate isomerase/deaminase
MKFILDDETVKLQKALVKCLNDELAQNEPVLWLVPGGSNIKVAVKIMGALNPDNLHNLTIALTDERYGNSGHKDSNFYQLAQAGFDIKNATFTDLLTGENFEKTVEASNAQMAELFAAHKTVVGFFGMGADGHIAGILPHSPAAVKVKAWMIGYNSPPLKRFTLTPFALSHVDIAILGAFGDEKLEPLKNLRDKMLEIADQPAQILRHVPEVYIYNNLIGDTE